jgi:hypothetical protein
MGEAEVQADTDMAGFPPNSYFQQSRRPIPKFDMNLRDLFSEDESNKRSFNRISNQISRMGPPPAPQRVKQEPQPMTPFKDAMRTSPQLRTHQQEYFDTNLRQNQSMHSPQQQHQQQQQQIMQHQTSNPTGLPTPLSQASMSSLYSDPLSAFQTNNFSQSYPDLGFSDLDFLDSYQLQGGESTNVAQDGLQDLGFGMGFGDGTHDFADGNGADLFGGFFFGVGPGGAGGPGPAGGSGSGGY